MRRAVFVDRDGVINAMVTGETGVDSPQRPEEFRLLEGAADGIRMIRGLGLPVLVVSNQPGIAKGKARPADLKATTEVLHAALADAGTGVDGVYYCLHHPAAVLDDYRMVCDCRKPRPGLLQEAALDLGVVLRGSYMIGDQPTDIQAGRAVGCTTLLVSNHPQDAVSVDHVCASLRDAALIIKRLETDAIRT